MRKFKKLTMALALLIAAVGGAWAQSTFGVKEITADMLPASWSTDESAVTADDLAKLGFMEVTEAEAQAWTGAPQQGNVRLIYTPCKSVNWVDGEGGYSTSSYTRKIFYSCLNGQKIFITTELTEWSLTPDETGKNWTLTKMPASDIELQVEYFAESNIFLGKDALADKANIAVKAGELGVQFGENGKSANTVTEGTAMTVTYNGTKKVIGIKAEKKAVGPSLTLTSPEVGQVIGSDGKNYAYASLPTGVTAVAKICYVSDGHGLALALADEEGKMNWSTAQTTCGAHTPAITGGTWKLATKDEWNNMINAAGYTDLRDGFSSVGGTNLLSDVYWSSTDYEGMSDVACNYSFSDGRWYADYKDDERRYVRACLAF